MAHFPGGRIGRGGVFILAGLLSLGLSAAGGQMQNESGGMDGGTCTLKDHVYTCNPAEFQQRLASAHTVAIQVHNADGAARSELTKLITKMHKTVAAPGTKADLVFLLMPVDATKGIYDGAVSNDLATLRIYTSTPEGQPEHLLWAETYRGMSDLPWPAVVNRVISQFQSHFPRSVTG